MHRPLHLHVNHPGGHFRSGRCHRQEDMVYRALLRTIVAGSLVAALAACQSRVAVEPATLIVHNANVYTIRDAQPDVEAVAVRGDRIVLVGTSANALALRGERTVVI